MYLAVQSLAHDLRMRIRILARWQGRKTKCPPRHRAGVTEKYAIAKFPSRSRWRCSPPHCEFRAAPWTRRPEHARHELGRRSRAPEELFPPLFRALGSRPSVAERRCGCVPCAVRAWYLSRACWSHDCILLRCSRQPRRELQHARDHRRCFWLLVALEGTAPVAVRSTCARTFGRVVGHVLFSACVVACLTSVLSRFR